MLWQTVPSGTVFFTEPEAPADINSKLNDLP
jgi:hypothetical protein